MRVGRKIGALFISAVILGVMFWPAPDWVPEPIADVQMTCFFENEPVAWSFCLNKTAGSENRDVLYYFHGRNGAATWWNDNTYYTGAVHRLWKERGRSPPTVASISFGSLWLLSDTQSPTEGGLLRVFLERVVPRVEHELGHPVERRMAVGESMGGVNALLVAFKSNGLFSRVAALCPPVAVVSVQSSMTDIYNYVKRSSISWKRAAMLLVFSRWFFPHQEMWLKNDPVSLSREFKPKLNPQLYLSCGRNDEWGCMEGAEAIVANVTRAGGTVEWHPRPGGHCDVDAESLATFLMGVP